MYKPSCDAFVLYHDMIHPNNVYDSVESPIGALQLHLVLLGTLRPFLSPGRRVWARSPQPMRNVNQ